MNVKIQLVCLFALFAVVLAQSPEQLKKVTEECKKKIPATKDELKVLDDLTAVPKTQNEFCIIACVYKGIGVMDANNKIMYDKAVEELEPLKKEKELYDNYAKFIKECIDEVKPVADECETFKAYSECIVKKAKQAGIEV